MATEARGSPRESPRGSRRGSLRASGAALGRLCCLLPPPSAEGMLRRGASAREVLDAFREGGLRPRPASPAIWLEDRGAFSDQLREAHALGLVAGRFAYRDLLRRGVPIDVVVLMAREGAADEPLFQDAARAGLGADAALRHLAAGGFADRPHPWILYECGASYEQVLRCARRGLLLRNPTPVELSVGMGAPWPAVAEACRLGLTAGLPSEAEALSWGAPAAEAAAFGAEPSDGWPAAVGRGEAPEPPGVLPQTGVPQTGVRQTGVPQTGAEPPGVLPRLPARPVSPPESPGAL